jgi:predicted nucleic acid-binding protein
MLFVYVLEEHPEHAPRVRSILHQMEERKDTLCTSSFAVGEALVGPYKKGDRESVERIRKACRPPFVQVLPFTDEVADHYGRIRAVLGIPPADAVHLATAAQAGVDVFLTNDRKLAGQIIPGIQFVAGLDCNLF